MKNLTKVSLLSLLVSGSFAVNAAGLDSHTADSPFRSVSGLSQLSLRDQNAYPEGIQINDFPERENMPTSGRRNEAWKEERLRLAALLGNEGREADGMPIKAEAYSPEPTPVGEEYRGIPPSIGIEEDANSNPEKIRILRELEEGKKKEVLLRLKVKAHQISQNLSIQDEEIQEKEDDLDRKKQVMDWKKKIPSGDIYRELTKKVQLFQEDLEKQTPEQPSSSSAPFAPPPGSTPSFSTPHPNGGASCGVNYNSGYAPMPLPYNNPIALPPHGLYNAGHTPPYQGSAYTPLPQQQIAPGEYYPNSNSIPPAPGYSPSSPFMLFQQTMAQPNYPASFSAQHPNAGAPSGDVSGYGFAPTPLPYSSAASSSYGYGAPSGLKVRMESSCPEAAVSPYPTASSSYNHNAAPTPFYGQPFAYTPHLPQQPIVPGQHSSSSHSGVAPTMQLPSSHGGNGNAYNPHYYAQGGGWRH